MTAGGPISSKHPRLAGAAPFALLLFAAAGTETYAPLRGFFSDSAEDRRAAASSVTPALVEPVTLSYCTVCGSGVLYSSSAFTFGTSGLLYRSNKLMVDRQTGTLWSNLTGEPVLLAPIGPEAAVVPMDELLERIPGHQAFWFGWYAFFPDSELYRGRLGK